MALKLKKFTVSLELLEDMLGTVPMAKDLYTKHLASKAKERLEKMRDQGIPMADGAPVTDEAIATAIKEETATVLDSEERGWTTFHKDGQGYFIYNYAVKGFLCEAARTLKEGSDDEGDSVKQLADKFKRYCFVSPRRIRLVEPMGTLERPLRAQTAKGPRVALVRSDFIAAGTQLSFELALLDGGGISVGTLKDVLSYGALMGLGQWRSGGYGTFGFTLAEEDGKK
jgi:hypothetical protein